MKNFLSKFKFFLWSWEIDIPKIIPYLVLFVSFLPILPFEKKEGRLIRVMGLDASVSNFYSFGIKSLRTINGEFDSYKPKEGEAFFELNEFYNKNWGPNTLSQTKILKEKGYEKKLISCLILRDFYIYNFFLFSEVNYLINSYTPSPVPAIWVIRLLVKEYLVQENNFASQRFEYLKSYINYCSDYGDRFMPPGYLENKFEYKRNNF